MERITNCSVPPEDGVDSSTYLHRLLLISSQSMENPVDSSSRGGSCVSYKVVRQEICIPYTDMSRRDIKSS